ncbi:MAG: periplasmic heavy metal sensor [Bacteroidetes bacterium]|nr:periplasmic heavy metal sensor [Bacteroidota bacterium]
MNYFSKYRVVFWIMILMVLINISAFTSFFFFYRANKANIADTMNCSGTCRFLNEKLALNAEQTAKVSEINKKFRDQTEPVVAEIKNTRTAMLDELSSVNPDTARLSQYTQKIGELQKSLQKAAIVQFQQLKQICTPDQCVKLSAIYSEVYGCNKMGQGMEKSMQYQYRYGKKNQGCEKNH